MLIWLLIALALLVGLFLLLSGNGSGLAHLDGGEIVYLVAGLALLAFLVIPLIGDYRGRATQALRHAAVWVAVFLALITAYAFRQDLSLVARRVAGELLPPGEAVSVDTGSPLERAVRIRKRGDGHFAVRAEVNGAAMPLLVDTGASTVVLKPAEADRAGIDTRSLTFSVPVQTANGTTYAAPVRLRAITIGGITIQDVEALVAKPGNLKENLLGMSFLKRLRSYEFSGEFLTLRS